MRRVNVSEAFARAFFHFGPSERFSFRDLVERRIRLLILWHPTVNPYGKKSAEKVVAFIERCYSVLLQKIEK